MRQSGCRDATEEEVRGQPELGGGTGDRGRWKGGRQGAGTD